VTEGQPFPYSPSGPSHIQLVKNDISFVFEVDYGTGWQDSAIGQAFFGSKLVFSVYFQLVQSL